MKKFFLILITLLSICRFSQASILTPEADQIYKKHHKAIVQIRVISRNSKEKTALGSGFFFTEDGLIATNYHVVSQAVNYPSLYSIEYVTHDGTQGALKLLNIDPVHDLAILESNLTVDKFLTLGSSDLKKGDKILSFGNPYDLGLIIIEGLFNGVLKHTLYRKILFSGALNSGMSGGPAVLTDGTVFGINVSSAGNDISFFVPVEFLIELKNEIDKKEKKAIGHNWRNTIEKRIIKNQDQFLANILEQDHWEKDFIGIAQIPSNISNEFKCWGQTGDNKKNWIQDEYLRCSTEDSIFLSSTLYTGEIYYQYEWYRSRWQDAIRFYNIYEKYAANREFAFRNAYERDVENFSCKQNFVNIDQETCKVDVCMRSYKDYNQLFDVSFQITRTNLLSNGFVINGAMLGFTELQSKAFMRKFFKEIKWQK